MRSVTRIALLIVSLALVVVPPATAQSKWNLSIPIVMGLAEDGYLFTVAAPTFTGCNEAVVLNSMAGTPGLDLWSVIFLEDPEDPTATLHWVDTPLGAANITRQADVWIRVFPLVEGDLAEFLAHPCSFYDTHDYVAEGLGRMNYHSVDDTLAGPGVNTWGFTLQGKLMDTGYCLAGKSPELFWNQKWVTKSQTDYSETRSTASKGPTLKCR